MERFNAAQQEGLVSLQLSSRVEQTYLGEHGGCGLLGSQPYCLRRSDEKAKLRVRTTEGSRHCMATPLSSEVRMNVSRTPSTFCTKASLPLGPSAWPKPHPQPSSGPLPLPHWAALSSAGRRWPPQVFLTLVAPLQSTPNQA